MTGRNVDTAFGYAEVFGDLLAHGGVGAVVDGWRCRSHKQSPGTFTADLIALRPGNDSDVEQRV
jgi:hypothetical protein